MGGFGLGVRKRLAVVVGKPIGLVYGLDNGLGEGAGEDGPVKDRPGINLCCCFFYYLFV